MDTEYLYVLGDIAFMISDISLSRTIISPLSMFVLINAPVMSTIAT